MANVENSMMDKIMIEKVIDNKKYNEIILDYYKKLSLDEEFINKHLYKSVGKGYDDYKNTLINKIINIDVCNKFWVLDKYKNHLIKDLISQNLCRDKFCSNCKKVKQSARMAKYNDELGLYKDKLYHLTLTIPNVEGLKLRQAIKHMAKCFKYLTEYLRGSRKTKDIDFLSWGYEGAVRSLEVTFKDDSYHPHYHVALVLNDDVLSKKDIENTYSYNYRSGTPELKRLFSKEEVLIQKVWYLLINKVRVNKKNIDLLDLGYSCSMDKFKEDNYTELFKYMTKEVNEEGYIFTYDNFKILYYSLYNVKQIQGYGCLYRIKDNIDLEEFELLYREFIESLRQKEKASRVLQTPEDLLLDDKYKLISRKSYFKHLRDTLLSD